MKNQYLVFNGVEKATSDFDACLRLSLKFELAWYELKKSYYKERSTEDDKKINEIITHLA